VPKASISVSRNYDYDFVNAEEGEETMDNYINAYRISKPVRIKIMVMSRPLISIG
jgi:hypothetical protein